MDSNSHHAEHCAKGRLREGSLGTRSFVCDGTTMDWTCDNAKRSCPPINTRGSSRWCLVPSQMLIKVREGLRASLVLVVRAPAPQSFSQTTATLLTSLLALSHGAYNSVTASLHDSFSVDSFSRGTVFRFGPMLLGVFINMILYGVSDRFFAQTFKTQCVCADFNCPGPYLFVSSPLQEIQLYAFYGRRIITT